MVIALVEWCSLNRDSHSITYRAGESPNHRLTVSRWQHTIPFSIRMYEPAAPDTPKYYSRPPQRRQSGDLKTTVWIQKTTDTVAAKLLFSASLERHLMGAWSCAPSQPPDRESMAIPRRAVHAVEGLSTI
jgi:hypothetical protein